MTLTQAIEEFGSVSEIANALGISVQAVYKWGDKVPPLRVYQLRDMRKSPHQTDGLPKQDQMQEAA